MSNIDSNVGINSSKTITLKNPKIEFIIKYFLILIACYLMALIVSPSLWVINAALFHTVLELVCIFISLAIFFVLWFKYETIDFSNQIIGFGFLATAIFDMFHTYCWMGLKLFPAGCYGIANWHWLMGRFTEVIILLYFIFGYSDKKINKWIALIITIIYAFGISLLFLGCPEKLPMLVTEQGLTKTKIIFEYIIIILFAITACNLKKGMKNNCNMTYNYLMMALLLVIPTELCFTLYLSIASFSSTLGHILKITSYYYLFKGIFASSIIYPYKKLENSKNELERFNYKLEKNNKHYYDLLNKLPIALINYESKNRVKYANVKALKILGTTYSEIDGLTIREMGEKFFYYENKLKEIKYNTLNEYEDFINKGNLTRPIRNIQGEKINLIIETHRLDNDDLIVMFSDAKKEQEIVNLQIQTKTILNSISNTVSMMDKHNKIIMCNKAFEDVFEVESKDIIGMDRTEFNRLMQFSRMDVPNRDESVDGKAYEVSMVTLNSNKKKILLMPALIHNIEGEKVGYISIGTDITEFTKEQQKIQQQEKLAIIGQMGAGIVHETKNHLAAIKGYCQLLSAKTNDLQMKNYIDRIEQISADVNKVIVDFLSLAKPSETIRDITSINEIIGSMRYMLESPSFIKGVVVNINLGDFEKDILADEGQIKQVILNVAKNAIDAMSDSLNPKLDIATSLSDSQKYTLLTISDNGNGISKEDLGKIGTPFFTTKDTGTGLGLNVCYRIIKEHGGNIEVESQEGKGTTFVISLPCVEDITE